MSGMTAAIRAFGPMAAAILAIALVFVTGLDQRTVLPPLVEARFYGFFLDRYPLFALAIVYGVAAIAVAMAAPGRSGPIRRLIGGGLGVLLIVAVGLYPTFGGLVLRSAFATGGIAFLGQQAMGLAYALGSAAAAFTFGVALGIGRLLPAGRVRAGGRIGARLAGLGAGTLIRFVAVWFALACLGLAHAAGFGNWPHRPLTGADAVVASLLTFGGFLPYAWLDWRDIRSRNRPSTP